MTNNNVFVDIHVIQTIPPSNINRDDTGSPKTAVYGGVSRARVSSQSWKKAMRDYFREHYSDENHIGIRSKRIVTYIADEIQKIDDSIDDKKAIDMAKKVFNNTGAVKSIDKELKQDTLFLISKVQAKNLAQAAINKLSKKEELQEILNKNISLDIALFGRMVASNQVLGVDASSQVAHGISTHEVNTEFDFYTAVDDLNPEDTSGAGMLGTIEYNSSTLYRYANVSAHELNKQLQEESESTVEAISMFIESFIKSVPTGHINSFAHQTVPQAVVVSVRKDRPVNLVTAFEEPVRSKGGYVKESIKRLSEEFNTVQKFSDKPALTLTIGVNEIGEEKENLEELIKKFSSEIESLIK
ncbi:MAG: type I-E CRISPR-associated protein Cas7/Cse4/CasC [Gallicola sp.]|nr:type I-E CRISPR-associated protein Cas7/Cse4/CasC [Gallicola sp.]